MNEPSTMLQDFIKAQAEFPEIGKDGKAAYGTYATLSAVMAAVRPVLNRHNFAVVQQPLTVDERPVLRTALMHTSGEVLETTLPLMLTKQDAQGLGSALTYARRYSLTALLGIAPDDDDDGQTAAKVERSKPAPRPVSNQATEQQMQLINGYLDKLAVDDEARATLVAKVKTEAQASDLITQLQGKVLERHRQEQATQEPNPPASPSTSEPRVVVDDAYKQETTEQLQSIGLSGVGERKFLDETTGAKFTKSLNDGQWRTLRKRVDAVLNLEEDIPEEWKQQPTAPDNKERAAGPDA